MGYLVIVSGGATTTAINDYFGDGLAGADLQDKAHEAFVIDGKYPNSNSTSVKGIDGRLGAAASCGPRCNPLQTNVQPPLGRPRAAFQKMNQAGCPRDWDEYGQHVKTGRRDVRRLVLELDRYVAGNHDAFCVGRVPTPAQEQARSVSRARQSFQEEKQRLAAEGRSTALYYGHRLEVEWYAPALWKDLAVAWPPIVHQLLAPWQRLLAAVEQELTALTDQVEAAAPVDLPGGMGQLTSQILDREICDRQRFQNRRQVGSYTGSNGIQKQGKVRRFWGRAGGRPML